MPPFGLERPVAVTSPRLGSTDPISSYASFIWSCCCIYCTVVQVTSGSFRLMLVNSIGSSLSLSLSLTLSLSPSRGNEACRAVPCCAALRSGADTLMRMRETMTLFACLV